MDFDTNVHHQMLTEASERPGNDPIVHASQRRIGHAITEVLGGIAPGKVDRSDAQLLNYLDRLFGSSLERSRSGTCESASAHASSGMSPAARLMAERQAERARDVTALETFKSQRHAATSRARPRLALPAHRTMGTGPLLQRGKRVPLAGLGPRLIVGFDAEWQYKAKGRNRIISVQFYVIGPTGETYERLFDLAEDHDRDQRLTLADALDVVLDEAEQAGVFEHWPHEIILTGHFLPGDIVAFADFHDVLRPQLEGVNRTMATVSEPARINLPMDDERVLRLKSRLRYVVGDDFQPHELKVRLLDTSRLAPPGTSLEKIGKWLNEPKVTLPEGHSKDQMLRFKRQEPESFRRYAIHDARLAALYLAWVMWFSSRHLGLDGVSATISALSVRLAELCMRKDGVHPDVALNFEIASTTQWSRRSERLIRKKSRIPKDIRRWLEPFLADVYQGGRNEAYVYGPSDEGTLWDCDLASAYVSGLALPMVLDYDKAMQCQDPYKFIGHVAGYAQVDFQFPAVVRFPCLPVQVGAGLWFPLKGRSLCTAPEIELALNMGATITVKWGLIIPWKDRQAVFEESAPLLARWNKQQEALKAKGMLLQEDDDRVLSVLEMPPPCHGDAGYRPMESFAIYIRHMRQKFRRKTLPFEFIKLVGNGLYGKTGQGFKGKRSFSPKVLESVVVGPSRVSEPAIAALVCGFVRAVVSEILSKLPADARVMSLTTDGALMSVPIEQLDLSGPICRRFQALTDRVAPGTSMLDLKHVVRQVFVPRTRGVFTVMREGEHPAIIAKAGHKVLVEGDETQQDWLKTAEGESDWMIRLALGRYPGQKIRQPAFFPLSDMMLNHWDLQTMEREVRVGLEPDFKRKPVNVRMVRMEPYDAEHLAFDTVPWPTVEEGTVIRELAYQWRQKNCFKTMQDWFNWQAFVAHHMGNRFRRSTLRQRLSAPAGRTTTSSGAGDADQGSRQITRGKTGVLYLTGNTGSTGILVRTFLTAFVQRAWGLESCADRPTQAELAAWLTGHGHETKVHDVKNAGRATLNEGVVAGTPEVLALLTMLKDRFPTLQTERFLIDPGM